MIDAPIPDGYRQIDIGANAPERVALWKELDGDKVAIMIADAYGEISSTTVAPIEILAIADAFAKMRSALINRAWVTCAPESYDGFGTFTIERLEWRSRRNEQARLVYIPPQAQLNDWQQSRYGSGMYPIQRWSEWKENEQPINGGRCALEMMGYTRQPEVPLS